MEEVIIPLDSESNDHGLSEYNDGERRGKECLRYHTYLIPEEVEQKTVTAFRSGNDLTIAAKSEEKVASEDSAVVVDRDMTDIRSKSGRHVQACVIFEDD